MTSSLGENQYGSISYRQQHLMSPPLTPPRTAPPQITSPPSVTPRTPPNRNFSTVQSRSSGRRSTGSSPSRRINRGYGSVASTLQMKRRSEGLSSRDSLESAGTAPVLKGASVNDKILRSVAGGDFYMVKWALCIFPLYFREKASEIQYAKHVNFNFRHRFLLLSLLSIVTIPPMFIVLANIISSGELSLPRPSDKVLFYVSFTLTILASLLVGVIPFVPVLVPFPEISIIGITGMVFFGVTLCFGIITVNIRVSPGYGHAVLMKMIVDVVLFACSAIVLLSYCSLIECRTKLSFFVVNAMSATQTIIYIIQMVVIPNVPLFCRPVGTDMECEISANAAIIMISMVQIMAGMSVATLTFLARCHGELVERVEFCKYLKGLERIKNLQQKKSGTGRNGTTPIEDLMELISNSQKLVKGAAAFEPNPTLKEVDKLLKRCLEMLSKTDELFTIHFEQKNQTKTADETTTENLFYCLYTNKRGGRKTINPEVLAPVGSISTVIVEGEPLQPLTSKALQPHGSAAHNTEQQATTEFDPNDFSRSISKKRVGASRTSSVFATLSDDLVSRIQGSVGYDWSLNILALSDETPNVLVNVGAALLVDRVSYINCSRDVLINFLTEIEKLYLQNPYHNKVHGAMVAHSTVALSGMLGLFSTLDSRSSSFNNILLSIAALCHDVGHPGRNNAFLVNSYNAVTMLYNDISVLEHLHTTITFKILQHPACDITMGLSREDSKTLRKVIVELILATDMGQHFEAISRFRIRRRSPEFDYFRDSDDMWLVAKLCIKAGDLSHAMVDWQQHLLWALRVTEEFYQQGENENELSMPLSPLCDRNTHNNFPKSQKGFIEFVVQPLVKELEELESGDFIGYECTRCLVHNKYKWEEMIAADRTEPIPAALTAVKTMSVPPEDILLNVVFNKSSNLQLKSVRVSEVLKSGGTSQVVQEGGVTPDPTTSESKTEVATSLDASTSAGSNENDNTKAIKEKPPAKIRSTALELPSSADEKGNQLKAKLPAKQEEQPQPHLSEEDGEEGGKGLEGEELEERMETTEKLISKQDLKDEEAFYEFGKGLKIKSIKFKERQDEPKEDTPEKDKSKDHEILEVGLFECVFNG